MSPKKNDSKHNFSHFVDKAFFALLTGAVILATQTLTEMGKSIEDLNRKVTTAIIEVSEFSDRFHRVEAVQVLQSARQDDQEAKLMELMKLLHVR